MYFGFFIKVRCGYTFISFIKKICMQNTLEFAIKKYKVIKVNKLMSWLVSNKFSICIASFKSFIVSIFRIT